MLIWTFWAWASPNRPGSKERIHVLYAEVLTGAKRDSGHADSRCIFLQTESIQLGWLVWINYSYYYCCCHFYLHLLTSIYIYLLYCSSTMSYCIIFCQEVKTLERRCTYHGRYGGASGKSEKVSKVGSCCKTPWANGEFCHQKHQDISGYFFGGCKHNFWFISPNWMMILMFIIVHLESGGGKHAYTFRGKLPDVAILVPQTGMLLAYICTYLCSWQWCCCLSKKCGFSKQTWRCTV